MKPDILNKSITEFWDNKIVPTLIEYIKIPNKSPSFDPDWEKHGHNIPLLVNLQPAGAYLGEDYHHAGGVPAVVAELIRHGQIHEDAITVNGKTIGENHKDIVFKDISSIFAKNQLSEYEYVYNTLADGKSIAYISDFELDTGFIRIYCIKYSNATKKEIGFRDSFSIDITTQEYINWINEEAY